MGIHRNVLHNGRIECSDTAVFRPGQIGILAGWGVFTTLRVRHAALFAWERHWARMSRDARLLNLELPSPDEVHAGLLRLIEANNQTECTLRLVFVRNSGGLWEDAGSASNPVDFAAMTADSKQWHHGVRLGVRPDARHAACEFAGAKLLSWAQNLSWAERAHLAGEDEVVLLNEHGRVAECTSANIFAVFGENAVTPPLSEGCLPGITREILLELSGDGTQVTERQLSLADLHAADAVFITSSTRNLLTVGHLEGRALRQSGNIPARLSARFDAFVEEDLAERPRAGAGVCA